MGSNHSKVLESFECSPYDDTDIREYLINLLNDDPESFEENFYNYNTSYVRPYGPIRNNRIRATNLWLRPWGLLISSEGINEFYMYKHLIYVHWILLQIFIL